MPARARWPKRWLPPPAPTLPLPADRRAARPRASGIQLLRISMHVEVCIATVALPLHPAKEGDPMPETEAAREEGSMGKAGSVLACIVIIILHHQHPHHHRRRVCMHAAAAANVGVGQQQQRPRAPQRTMGVNCVGHFVS